MKKNMRYKIVILPKGKRNKKYFRRIYMNDSRKFADYQNEISMSDPKDWQCKCVIMLFDFRDKWMWKYEDQGKRYPKETIKQFKGKSSINGGLTFN